MKYRQLKRMVLLLVLVVLMGPSQATANVLLQYEHYVYAVGSDGIPIMGQENLPGETSYFAEYTKTGHPEAGNYGHVHYGADLASGRVQAYAYSQGRVADYWPNHFTATGRVQIIKMQDAITFVVPAGTYPEGVTVTLHGTFKGTLWSQFAAGARALARVEFGAASYDCPLVTVGIEEDGTHHFDEVITLSLELVGAGIDLEQAESFTKNFTAHIGSLVIWSVTMNPGNGYVSGAAEGQFYDGDNGVSITDVQVPPGVTWSSESGVFLSHLVPAPEEMPEKVAPFLEPNYPNPFNPRTTLVFNLGEPGPVDLEICDVRGHRVCQMMAQRVFSAGRHEVPWDGRDSRGRPVPAGVYFCLIRAQDQFQSRPMIMVK